MVILSGSIARYAVLPHIYIYIYIYILGMHDIYRTDKLSTDMGENDVIFIAPINT